MSDPDFGVLLMTYGSPTDDGDVARYLAAVRGGRAAEPALVEEFTRRYRAIGGSPLIPLTVAQAVAVEAALDGRARVLAAMRFSEPSITTALTGLQDAGVTDVAAIVLSPQYSPLLMGGYARDLAAAQASLRDRIRVRVAGAWHDHPSFVAALAEHIRAVIDALPIDERATAPVLLTAHSLPLRIATDEPAYLAQLEATATSVAEAAGIEPSRWTFCWQSAGHEPGEWMKPDFADLMPGLAAEGHRSVVVAPVQFLSDHLETLYDVDIAARAQAEEFGLRFLRIAPLNDDPGLAGALADVARATIGALRAEELQPAGR
jgi:ferrochelatase